LALAGVAVTVLSLGYDLTQPLLAGIVTDLSANRGQAMALNVFTLFAGFGLGSLVFQLLLGRGIPVALEIFGAAALLAGALALPAFRREARAHEGMRPELPAVSGSRTEGQLTAQSLAKAVQARLPAVDTSTIYRTLELLEKLDVVRHSHQEGGVAYHRVGEEDHVHLCFRCGRQDDLPAELAEQLRRRVIKHHGFEPDLTHFAISGLCVSCRESES